MKFIKTIILLIIVNINSFSQTDNSLLIEKANGFIKHSNNKDFENYTKLLIPSIYNNDEDMRLKYVELFDKLKKNDKKKYHSINTLKSNNNQAILEVKHGERQLYLFSLLNNENQWLFSTYYGELKVGHLLRDFKEIDSEILDFINPNWRKVEYLSINEKINEFKWKDLDGNIIKSSDIKDKIIVLNFWNQGCSPCFMEMPELNEIVKKHKDVVFLAPIPLKNKNQEKFVEILKTNILEKHKFDYQVVFFDNKEIYMGTYPTHVVINKDKIITDLFTGYSPSNIERLENSINEQK